jgi:hypothetical protein
MPKLLLHDDSVSAYEGKSMSDENKKSAVNKISSEELQEDFGDTLFSEGKNIADWPDYKFSTPDGRVFGFFEDGESIGKRLTARNILVNKHDWNRLEDTAGMIIQTVDGVPDDPMVFRDRESLLEMWLQLHKSHGVPLSEDELAAFDVEPNEDEDEEE